MRSGYLFRSVPKGFQSGNALATYLHNIENSHIIRVIPSLCRSHVGFSKGHQHFSNKFTNLSDTTTKTPFSNADVVTGWIEISSCWIVTMMAAHSNVLKLPKKEAHTYGALQEILGCMLPRYTRLTEKERLRIKHHTTRPHPRTRWRHDGARARRRASLRCWTSKSRQTWLMRQTTMPCMRGRRRLLPSGRWRRSSASHLPSIRARVDLYEIVTNGWGTLQKVLLGIIILIVLYILLMKSVTQMGEGLFSSDTEVSTQKQDQDRNTQ